MDKGLSCLDSSNICLHSALLSQSGWLKAQQLSCAHFMLYHISCGNIRSPRLDQYFNLVDCKDFAACTKNQIITSITVRGL